MRARLALLLALVAPSCASLRAATAQQPDACARLDAGDIVRILADHEVKHVALPPFPGGELLGVTHYKRREILLNARFDGPLMRLTALHELLHVRHNEEGRSNDDAFIAGCALAAYQRMYGGIADLPPEAIAQVRSGR